MNEDEYRPCKDKNSENSIFWRMSRTKWLHEV